ncbi:gag-pol, partial [Mucuna pruriens]
MQHLEAATMVPLGRPGRYSIAGSIDPPFSKTPINSSPPTRNVKKLEWPLAEGIRCLNDPYCSAKSLMFNYVSRWVEAIATKTNDAKVVVNFLKSNIFYQFGVPKALISDQGSDFCNRAMSSLLYKYGVTNSQAEVFNTEIKKTLQKMTHPSRKDWSQLLEDALWAHRTTYRTLLGISPYRIVFGKAYHFPVEIERRAYWAASSAIWPMTKQGNKGNSTYKN